MNKSRVTVSSRDSVVKGIRYTYYRVDCGRVDGRRVMKQFKTKKEAEEFAKNIRKDRDAFGKQAFKLTPEQRADAAEAIAILSGESKPGARTRFPEGSLRSAVAYYVRHNAPVGGNRSTEEAFIEFMEDQKSENLRKATLDTYTYLVGRFAKDHAETPIGDITATVVNTWLTEQAFPTTATRNAYRRHLHAFFQFAKLREYTHHDNPAARKQKRHRRDKKQIAYLTAEEAERVLDIAVQNEPDMVPYIAIALFAGLRPSEIHGERTEHGPLPFAKIDFERGYIEIDSSQDKNREGRKVRISDNLRSWLVAHPTHSDDVFYSRGRLRNVFKRTETPFTKDVFRHTFGTQHWAMHEDEGKTAIQLGDTIATVKRHYVNTNAEKEDAEKFWAILPEAAGVEAKTPNIAKARQSA